MSGAEPRPPGWRARRWRRRLLAATLGCAAAFVALEIGARALVGTPLVEQLPLLRVQANEHRGWEMMPSELHYTYSHPVLTNAYGLRGPELEVPKPEGVVRVLALGDSLIYGQGVADDETLPFYMERALEERDPRGRSWEVVNAGHRAYSTNQELGLLEELGAELEADVVVMFWYWNDVFERGIAETCATLEASGPIAFDIGAPHEGWALWKWRAQQLARRSAFVMWLYDELRLAGEPEAEPGVREGAMQAFEGYLERFGELSEQHGWRFGLAVVPDSNELLGPYVSSEYEALVRERLDARAIPVLRLLPAVQAVYEPTGELPILLFDGHYRPDANRAMADTAADFVLELEATN